jgi:hypothetical protein
MSDFPKDGSTFIVEAIERTAYRWAKYKPDGARQMGKPGRWQKQVWSGDFFKWENCEDPVGELSPPVEDGPISKAFKQAGAKDVQIESLERELEEAKDVPWPDWANTILKTMQEFGYDPVVDGEVNLGEAFKDYLEGVGQEDEAQRAALSAKDAEIERYRKALLEILGYDRNFYDNGRPGYEAIARAALTDEAEGRS